MQKSTRSFWLRIIGWALLIHIILIALSFIEVFIYSAFINPGHDQAFYNAHAMQSAPYVAIIAGIPVFFFVARWFARKWPDKKISIALGLSMAYIVIDLLVLIPYGVDFGSHALVFFLSFGTKLLAAFAGVYLAGSSSLANTHTE